MSLLSWVQAPALWHESDVPQAKAVFAAISGRVQPLFASAPQWFVENKLFPGVVAVFYSHWLPLAVATVVALTLLVMLSRAREDVDAGILPLLFKWSLAFAGVSVLAFPVFAQDFWLSAAWGRMIASGVNPYYNAFTPESLAGLPLDHFPMMMSYGPLWGLMSAGLMLLAGGSIVMAGLLFKVLLAAAWIGTLWLVGKVIDPARVKERALGLCMFGWLPLGVTQSLMEGHNDIAMMVFAALWIFLLVKGRTGAPIALAASMLCKYVSAPLFLIDLVWALRQERKTLLRYALRMAVPAVLGLATFALFYRSPQFFDGLVAIGGWRFLQPRDAVLGVEMLLGVPMTALTVLALGFFPAVALYQLVQLWKAPDADRLLMASGALIAALLFVGIKHVWPWYLIWALTLAAMKPSWWLSRMIVGIAAVAPFTLASWWIDDLFEAHREVAALAMYGSGLVWMWLMSPVRTRQAVPDVQEPLAASTETVSSGAVAGG
jgi:alpha-1,6-mannosyltransferase